MKHIKYYNNFNKNISYHLDNNLSLLESIFRIESKSWIDLINESKKLYESGDIDLNEDEKWLLSTDVGLSGYYKSESVLLDVPFEIIEESNKHKLNKPFRTPGERKKFGVYTKNDEGNVVLVRFGDPNMKIRNNDPKRAKSFQKRHHCENPGPKWKPKYWSCNVHRYRKLLGLKSNRPW